MNTKPTVDDIAGMRAEGSLGDYLRLLTGRPAETPPEAAVISPAYVIPRKGAWPVGTAASGPTPGCPCSDCHPAV